MDLGTTDQRVGPDAFRSELRGSLDLLAELRRRLHAFLAEHGVVDDDASDVVLAVQESCANALTAGSGHPVSLVVWISARTIWVRVRDHGRGFCQGVVQPPPNALQTRGRGLYLMRALMDSVSIECSAGTLVSMRRRLTTFKRSA
jgi:anti-sigma regulatory factor (Ser/Thr protein kinase)